MCYFLRQGRAHCFEKDDENNLEDCFVIEPISANSLECMAVGMINFKLLKPLASAYMHIHNNVKLSFTALEMHGRLNVYNMHRCQDLLHSCDWHHLQGCPEERQVHAACGLCRCSLVQRV